MHSFKKDVRTGLSDQSGFLSYIFNFTTQFRYICSCQLFSMMNFPFR